MNPMMMGMMNPMMMGGMGGMGMGMGGGMGGFSAGVFSGEMTGQAVMVFRCRLSSFFLVSYCTFPPDGFPADQTIP